MQRKKKKIKRTPVKAKVLRTPVCDNKTLVNRSPVVFSRVDPSDDPTGFATELKKAHKRVQKDNSFQKEISTEVGFIEHLTETNLEPTKLYHYQKKWMNDRNKYRHGSKSRQIGQSYTFACEGYSKSQLMKIYTGIFVSYNQEEANEKIVYARALHESVSNKYKKKLVVDRITALEFEGLMANGRKTKTRLISHPQREPRGKGYNTDVFLDEIAHYLWPQKVYVAAVPIVTRGFGQLSMASSPLGKSGLHYEIGHDKEKYSMFSRHVVYWWDNPDFLNEDALKNIKEVQKLAPTMETLDRVLEFGNDAIIQAYYSMIEEDFQQEYEVQEADDSVSYYPMDLINQCLFEELSGYEILEEDDLYGDNPVRLDPNPLFNDILLKTFESPEQLSHAISLGTVGKLFFAGFDVGRDENNSELIILEELPNKDHLQIVRLLLTMKKTEFRQQFNILDKIFNIIPIKKLKIDSTGMGRNLGEDLRRKFHSRVDDIKFTNENKNDMATNLKLRMEDQSIALPNNRDLKRQIHSVKRVVSANSIVKFEVTKNRLHHGDKFWALALASSAGEPAQMHQVKLVTANTVGKIAGSKRILPVPPKKTFVQKPIIDGVDFRKLPPPPKHNEEFLSISDAF